MTPLALAEALVKHHDPGGRELLDLLTHRPGGVRSFKRPDPADRSGPLRNQVFIRGLIEFTNYCKNDCYYCGIRRSKRNAQRYRLTKEDILACCGLGYQLAFAHLYSRAERTLVYR